MLNNTAFSTDCHLTQDLRLVMSLGLGLNTVVIELVTKQPSSNSMPGAFALNFLLNCKKKDCAITRGLKSLPSIQPLPYLKTEESKISTNLKEFQTNLNVKLFSIFFSVTVYSHVPCADHLREPMYCWFWCTTPSPCWDKPPISRPLSLGNWSESPTIV